jgi:hypothetical protein
MTDQAPARKLTSAEVGGPRAVQTRRRAAAPSPGRSRWLDRSPLRNPLPAIAAAVTVFLVVLALLIARLSSGFDPALHPIASTPAVAATAAGGQRHTVLRTTASGRTILTSEAGPGQVGTGAAAPSVSPRTRASGATGGRDD